VTAPVDIDFFNGVPNIYCAPPQPLTAASWCRDRVYAAIDKLQQGKYADAVKTYEATPRYPLTDEGIASIKVLYPSSDPANFPLPPQVPNAGNSVPTISVKDIRGAINSIKVGKAGGVSGWTPDNLRALIAHASQADLKNLANFLTRIAKGDIDIESAARDALAQRRGVALSKPDGRVRPIAVGESLLLLVSKILVYKSKKEIVAALHPLDFGYGKPAGAEAAIHAARALLDADPTRVIIKCDVQNAYNSIERSALLETAAEMAPALLPLADLMYRKPFNVLFEDPTTGRAVCISSDNGTAQGEPMSGPLYCGSMTRALDGPRKNNPAVSIFSFVDDTFIIGPPAPAVQAFRDVRNSLKSMLNVKIGSQKTRIFSPSQIPANVLADCLAEHIKPMNALAGERGVALLGGFVGDDDWVKAQMAAAIKPMQARLVAVRSIATTAHASRDDILQSLQSVVRYCVIPMAAHFGRTTPPQLCGDALKIADADVATTVQELFAFGPNSTNFDPAITPLISALPLAMGGLGFTALAPIAPASYVSSLALVGPHLARADPSLVRLPAAAAPAAAPAALSLSPDAFPSFAPALAVARARSPKSLAAVSLSSIATAPYYKLHAEATNEYNTTMRDWVQSELAKTSQPLAARFESNAHPFAGAWLTASCLTSKIPNNFLSIAVADRLLLVPRGMPVLPRCSACNVSCSPVDIPHALVCPKLRHVRTYRHTEIAKTVHAVFTSRLNRDAFGASSREPSADKLIALGWAPKQQAGEPRRTDGVVEYGGSHRSWDVTVVVTARDYAAKRKPGVAARAAEARKVNEYKASWVIPKPEVFAPVGFEMTGALGDGAETFLREITHAAARGDRGLAAFKFRALVASIGATIQRHNAWAFDEWRRRFAVSALAPPAVFHGPGLAM
jgi:hypothetical protein